MHEKTLPLSLVFTGFIVAAAGTVNLVYSNKLRNADLEKFQATVTKIRPVVRSASFSSPQLPPEMSIYCPEAEYLCEGEIINAHYVSMMMGSAINFSVGDTIDIFVDPKKPKEFFLGNENFKKSEYVWAIVLIGVVLLAAGIILLIGGSL